MHKVYIQMKDNDSLNTKNTMSVLAAMIVFKINEVKGQNTALAHVSVNRFYLSIFVFRCTYLT